MIVDHIAALVMDLAVEEGGAITVFSADIPDKIHVKYGLEVNQETAESACEKLVKAGAAVRLESPLTGSLFEISSRDFFDLLNNDDGPNEHSSIDWDQRWQAARDQVPILRTYARAGDDWVRRILPALKAAIENEGAPPLRIDQFDSPASDRYVSRQDNLPLVEKIEDGLEQLDTVISQDNEVGAELGDEKDVIRDELAFAREAVQKDKIRVSSLLGWLVPVLKFLAKRFAGTSVDEAAKALLALLEKLL